MTTPKVLVGITTQNRAAYLPRALASVRAQRYPNLSIAVVDDGSTDTTPALQAANSDALWIRHSIPQGIIESRNELMRGTDAEYYVSLDDDAWFLLTDELQVAVEWLETHPQAAAVAFRCRT